MIGVDPALLAAARAWADQDPDALTKGELERLIDSAHVTSAAADELTSAFASRLEFGTAGLRGALGPGPNRMNRVVVMQAAAGLAAYLNAEHPEGCAVVIGFDARHNSDVFAHDTAAVLSGAGLSAMVFPHPCPTPVLAYAIRHLGCAAGVMVTASHNPPQDNGYKVYLGDGSQIVPPADSEIQAEILAVAGTPLADIALGDEWITLSDSIFDDYISRAAELVHNSSAREISIVYSAMHGVGADTFGALMAATGFGPITYVAEQREPDPDFPTVAFPNPEEPGAIDLSLLTARAIGADIVIANDPDADRCAVALPDHSGTWRMLRGDELGSVLAWWITQRTPAAARVGHTLAQSIVSCSLLERIAHDHGFEYQRTLTGFKWIGRIPGLAYGYEEALGYCVDPRAVKDKDGITAALLVAELAATLKAEGRTINHVLDDLAVTYGLYSTEQVSVRVTDASAIPRIIANLRANPPSTIGGRQITQFIDLESPDSGLPPTNGLLFNLAGNSRVIIRPSGTEPKVKAYLQCVQPVVDEAALPNARTSAAAELEAMAVDVRTWLA